LIYYLQSKQIIRQHGGHITIKESRHGQTIFKIDMAIKSKEEDVRLYQFKPILDLFIKKIIYYVDFMCNETR